jgi:pimeloyl-ACP methyl ester carboxylesterase
VIDILPRFTELRAAPSPEKARKVVVFVHGIVSSHATFAKLVDAFETDARFDAYDLFAYDYDWGEPILRSARRLRDILNARVPDGSEITLIGHSMGGLVSRFALVAGDLRGVRRIVMLGTPNFGALSARQLGTLGQIAIATAGKITPLFPRKAGLRDLTRPQTLYEQVVRDEKDDESVPPSRALTVEYVTIPGLFYWDERRDTETGEGNEALWFSVGGLVVKVLKAWPLSEIEIERPHDGIVEESSVNLDTSEKGRLSEKNVPISEPARYGHSYCHVMMGAMRKRTHMGIQKDPQTATAIKGIMLAGSVTTWNDGLTFAEHAKYIRIRIP